LKGDSIPVCRSIMEHWIYKDSDYFKAWFEMLARARYLQEPKTDMYEKIVYTLNRGEFIFGRTSWALRLGISEQKLRTLIKKLQRDNMIKLTSRYVKFSVYSIANYEKFNQQDNQQLDIQQEGVRDNDNQQNNQHLTSTQPAANQHPTTNKECKESKKVKKDIYISCQHLSMTEEEYKKLVEVYGENEVKSKLEYAENYKKLTNYKSLYLTLKNWLKADKTKEDKPQIQQKPKITNCSERQYAAGSIDKMMEKKRKNDGL